MNTTSYISPWEEHRFWLKILTDHAYFICDYLSFAEKKFGKIAEDYIQHFHYLRAKLKEIPPSLDVTSTELISFSREAHPVAYGYFSFESHLQYLRVRNEVNLNLTPTFLSGTLLENEEYLRILGYMMCGQQAQPLSLDELLNLWLEDQAGHAELLANGLDPIEDEIIRHASSSAKTFSSFLLQNKLISQMKVFTESDVPAQQKFVKKVILAVNDFNQLVIRVLQEYQDQQVLNRLTYRFLEHHLPETCYFLKKLSYFVPDHSDLIPDCKLVPPYFND